MTYLQKVWLIRDAYFETQRGPFRNLSGQHADDEIQGRRLWRAVAAAEQAEAECSADFLDKMREAAPRYIQTHDRKAWIEQSYDDV